MEVYDKKVKSFSLIKDVSMEKKMFLHKKRCFCLKRVFSIWRLWASVPLAFEEDFLQQLAAINLYLLNSSIDATKFQFILFLQ